MRTPLTFFVAGLPKAQPRPRAFRRGKFTGVYNPKTADDWKAAIRIEGQRAFATSGDTTPWTGPLCVNLTFYFPRPKNHFRSNGALKENSPKWHTCKPDRDNSDKAVLDTLTAIGVWHDDKQVCDGRIRKLYAGFAAETDIAGCVIEIKEAQNE